MKLNHDFFENYKRHQQFLKNKMGGVVFLKSFWKYTRPDILNKIVGLKCEVKVNKDANNNLYHYIEIPLSGNEYEELRLWWMSCLEEGDIVDISSIVVIFKDDDNGNTTLRYDAIYEDEDITEDSFILTKIKELMSYNKKSQKKPSKSKTSVKNIRDSSLCSLEDEEYWDDPLISRYSESERDNFYGMTDGMDGDLW